MATYTLISSNVLSSSAATVTFSAIPATYTDLVLRASVRVIDAGYADSPQVTFNGVTGTSYSNTRLLSDGATATSGRTSSSGNWTLLQSIDGASATANTFGSLEIYIPSYTASQNKPVSTIAVTEDNRTTAYIRSFAKLWSQTATVSSILINGAGATFAIGSSFYLYGISNA